MASDVKKSGGLTIWSYLDALRQRILWVIGVAVAVAAVAGLYSLTIPDQYQSAAQVVLLPPLVTTNASQHESRQLSPLSIDPLLKNAETAQRIFDQIRWQREILGKLANQQGSLAEQADTLAALPVADIVRGAGIQPDEAAMIDSLKPVEIEALLSCSDEEIKTLSIGSILGSLETSIPVETRMATETVYSPAITIRATMGNPCLARVVVNQAARVLTDRYSEMTMVRAEQAAAALDKQVAEQRQTLADLDKQMAEITGSSGNLNALERELYWLDRAYGNLLLRNSDTTQTLDLAALRERMDKLQAQHDAAKSKVDSLQMVRMVHVAALRTLLDTQAEVRFTPPARLKKMEVLSPAAPSAWRVGPDRIKLIALGAAVGLIFSLAGIFLLLLMRSSDPD